MAPKKSNNSGPLLFCEWVIGGPLPAARRSLQAKAKPPPPEPPAPPPPRDVIRVEVTTDDEKEEDTLKITFPRSGKPAADVAAAVQEQVAEAIVKKVRFEDEKTAANKKSAMKQPKGDESDSSATLADSASDASGESSDDESSSSKESASSNDDGKKKSKKKKKKKSKTRDVSSDDGSDSDGEPHPTCKCSRCVKKRRRASKVNGQDAEKAKKECSHCGGSSASDTSSGESSAASSDASESEDEAANQTQQDDQTGERKKKKKQKQQADGETNRKNQLKKDKSKKKQDSSSDADDEASESGKETSSATEDDEASKDKSKATTTAGKENNQKGEKKKKKTAAEPTAPKPDEKGNEKDTTAPDDGGNKTKKKQQQTTSSFAYPEVFAGPHSHRPNLIGPVRAQVVQTENVVETPDDPPPNAYYDAASNTMRVYYGPVYGNQHHRPHRPLYPMRDSAGRPLPLGMPYPTQNPYYYGFQNVHDGGGGVVPPGLPGQYDWNMGGVGGFLPPPGFPPFVVNPMLQQQQQQPEAAAPNGGKGAFSRKSSSVKAPSASQAEDKSGKSNVLPTSKIDENRKTSPYYTPSKTALELRSNGGSLRNSPARSAANTAAPTETNANHDGNAHETNTSGWDNNAGANAASNTNNDTWGANNDGSSGGGGGGDNNNNNNNTSNDNKDPNVVGWANNDGSSNSNNNNNESTWADNGINKNDTSNNSSGNGADNGTSSSYNASNTGDAPPPDDSNVYPGNMPGSWVSTTAPPASAPDPEPLWGDPSMAASTGGQGFLW